MKPTSKTYDSRRQRGVHFLIGFAAWLILNFGLFLLFGNLGMSVSRGFDLPTIVEDISLAALCLLPLLNLVALIYFGLTRRWIALGALAAFGLIVLVFILFMILIMNVGLA
jgi:hypothetical protein